MYLEYKSKTLGKITLVHWRDLTVVFFRIVNINFFLLGKQKSI
jgi:hypothetical protein